MFLFQLKIQPAKKESPKIWSIDAIRNAVGKDDCPVTVARQILKAKDIKQKIIDVKTSLSIIERTRDSGGFSEAIRDDNKFAEKFVNNPNRYAEIARVTKGYFGEVFGNINHSRIIREMFEKDDKKLTSVYASFVKAGVPYSYTFVTLGKDRIAAMFAKYPDRFVDLAMVAREYTSNAFKALENDKIAEMFMKDHKKLIAAFASIIRATGKADYAFGAVWDKNGRTVEMFLKYINGQLTLEQLMVNKYGSDNEMAIELGRPLDALHGNSAKRKAYLDKLSTAQVLGLLLSNPEYFYTSSNHLLFDRLKKDIRNKNIADVFAEYKVSPDLIRNFIFRTINYGRFYGRPNCLFSERDISNITSTVLQPMNSDKFDNKYYFLLANAVENMRTMPNVIQPVKQNIELRLNTLYQVAFSKGAEFLADAEKVFPAIKPVTEKTGVGFTNVDQTILALQYILWKMDSFTSFVPQSYKANMQAMEAKSYYDPSLYRGKDGRITIVQVFAKSDTENDHWPLTQAWASKYRKPVAGKNNELIYETKSARIVLYIAEGEDNQKFVKSQLRKYQNLIITFRGHSYSLQSSFPYEIFGNSDSHVLFIPGSCGSSGSTPQYLTKNPNTDLRFFSNTSTGRGQVTNALLDSLIETTKKTPFSEIIQRSGIKEYGGDLATMKVWSSGEALLKYVFGRK